MVQENNPCSSLGLWTRMCHLRLFSFSLLNLEMSLWIQSSSDADIPTSCVSAPQIHHTQKLTAPRGNQTVADSADVGQLTDIFLTSIDVCGRKWCKRARQAYNHTDTNIVNDFKSSLILWSLPQSNQNLTLYGTAYHVTGPASTNMQQMKERSLHMGQRVRLLWLQPDCWRRHNSFRGISTEL